MTRHLDTIPGSRMLGRLVGLYPAQCPDRQTRSATKYNRNRRRLEAQTLSEVSRDRAVEPLCSLLSVDLRLLIRGIPFLAHYIDHAPNTVPDHLGVTLDPKKITFAHRIRFQEQQMVRLGLIFFP